MAEASLMGSGARVPAGTENVPKMQLMFDGFPLVAGIPSEVLQLMLVLHCRSSLRTGSG